MVASTAVPAKRWRLDWLVIATLFLVFFNGLPFLAPVFMQAGWEGAGRAIYLVYSSLCHQMAQRSFFLFGPEGFQMYNLADLPLEQTGPRLMLASRAFLGSPEMGWKVAWSDRMVSMYISPLVVAVIYAVMRRLKAARGQAVRPLPLWAVGLLLLPMALDGGTHWVSDLAGIGQGFRDSNVWLAQLTNHAFPASFYAGDALGSFNMLMRLLSGITFGVAIGGFLYPWIDLSTQSAASYNEITSQQLTELHGLSHLQTDSGEG